MVEAVVKAQQFAKEECERFATTLTKALTDLNLVVGFTSYSLNQWSIFFSDKPILVGGFEITGDGESLVLYSSKVANINKDEIIEKLKKAGIKVSRVI